MHTNDTVDYDDEMEDTHASPRRRLDTRRPYARLTRKMAREANRFKQDQADARGRFSFTYQPARFEEWWLMGALGPLYENKWIRDVLRRVKSGKEACVYQCDAGAAIRPGLVAAKVYRPWSLRTMRNDWTYREGRADLDDQGRVLVNDGMLHAIQKRTEYGRELLHESWIAYEFKTLRALHGAGADVPQPLVMAGNVILMDFIGDAGRSAPTLNEVDLEPSERRPLFERVVHNIDVLLGQGRIHGDLSPYNILYWNGRISVIDFPQVVSPHENPNAYRIFARDLRRVCEYFTRQGLEVDAARLATEMWEAHGYTIEQEAAGEESRS